MMMMIILDTIVSILTALLITNQGRDPNSGVHFSGVLAMTTFSVMFILYIINTRKSQ
jgi:hypothetical protein